MKQIQISASPKQLSRLRNGHSVLLKRPIEGEGISIVVDPGRFNILSKTFDEGRGSRVILSPEEIAANVGIKGSGLGKSRKVAKKLAEAIFREPEEQSPLQITNVGGPAASLTPRTIKGVVDQLHVFGKMNQHLGTKFGVRTQATVGNAGAALKQAGHDIEIIDNRKEDQVFGTGLLTIRHEGGTIGRNGGLVQFQPPALMSQPYATNYQFSHTLPVAYQRFSGNGLFP
jgi:hypothetical protein